MFLIPTWSYSRLSVFEQCPFRAKLAFVDKIPEPDRPMKPGQTEHANDRGTRVHTAGEKFVTDNVMLVRELQPFAAEYEELRARYRANNNNVQVEQEWGFNRDWIPVSWSSSDIWARIKLDYFVKLSDTEAAVIDLKTGKLAFNEAKHAQQGLVYQLAAFLRDPDLAKVTVEFWYPDVQEITMRVYRRDQGLRFLDGITQSAERMTSAKIFPPKPSLHNCRFCPYKNTEHCDKGV